MESNQKGQPILLFTSSINKSEKYSNLLNKQKIKHTVLNAKNHEREAEIIANAGKTNSVIITTSISGRGVDIQLGGNVELRVTAALKGDSILENPEKLRKDIEASIEQDKKTALAAGGLYVLATERHESRRIDNQLRGRSGRQSSSAP